MKNKIESLILLFFPANPGPHFPRRGNKVAPRKMTLRPGVPELNMTLHPTFIEVAKVVNFFIKRLVSNIVMHSNKMTDP